MFLTLLLTACSPDSTLGSDLLTQLDAVRAEVADHTARVDGATSMDEVDQMEADHHDAMTAMMDDMSGMMSSMMGCGMGDDMMGSMSDAQDHMGQMSDEVDHHGQTQTSHTDMGECMGEEDDYADTMNGHLDAMGHDMGGFDSSASCPGGGMGMM